MFYQCSESSDSNDLNIVVFQCPNGTVYQDKTCSCGKPQAGDKCLKDMKRTLFEQESKLQNVVSHGQSGPYIILFKVQKIS